MHNLHDKVIGCIKEQKLTPKSRWWYIVHEAVVWGIGGVTVLIGALAVSVVLFALINSGGRPGPFGQRLAEVFAIIPFVWLVVLGLFAWLASWLMRCTKRGYRHELTSIILGVVLLSGIGGIGLFHAGIARHADIMSERHLPFHDGIQQQLQEYWHKPAQGRLTGQIVSADAETMTFVVEAPDGTTWQVSGQLPERYYYMKKTGKPVRLHGEVVTEGEFAMEFVRPWRGRATGGQTTTTMRKRHETMILDTIEKELSE